MPAATTVPVSRATEKDSQVQKCFTVRCFVYRERSSGLFVAECIDLDLMVKARKQNAVIRELRDAVVGYIGVAVDSGADSELIPRRSPLSHRLHYWAVRFACKLSLLNCDRLILLHPSVHARCVA
jgi:hypothetical protein